MREGENIPSRTNSRCKAPEVGMFQVCWCLYQDTSMAGKQWTKGKNSWHMRMWQGSCGLVWFFFFFPMVSFMLRCWHFSFLGNFWFQDVIPWLSWGAQEVIYDFFRGLCHSPFQLHGESGLCFQIAGEAFQIVLRFCRSQKKVKRK